MAYTSITGSEVTNGAPLDQNLLTKVKENFDILKSTADSQAGTLISHASSIGTNAADITDIRTQPGWTNITLTGPWTAYDTVSWGVPGYYKDEMGIVRLRGLVASGLVGTTICTLPVGFRPATGFIFSSMSSGGAFRIDAFADGRIIWAGSGASGWMSLAPVQFKTV